uniref:Reverse transcriptase zinc-binding domain-containing protein n=1 Tax=Trichogramma kaykai TaxID=54128 RepID=A0ABD2X736_9HYME
MDAQADPKRQVVDREETRRDCPVCPNTVEDTEHVFFNCIRFEEGREKLHRQLQDVARPENIVQLMLADEKN